MSDIMKVKLIIAFNVHLKMSSRKCRLLLSCFTVLSVLMVLNLGANHLTIHFSLNAHIIKYQVSTDKKCFSAQCQE